jgi:recombination associated protein RdgC
MFKNALIYHIENWTAPTLALIEERLGAARFVECGASQPESVGWVEPRGKAHGQLIESVAGQWLLQLCSETKAVPGSVVKTQLEAQLAKIEKDTGRRPKGKAAKEIKEHVVHALLPRAFPKRASTWVWFDLAAKRVLIAAASAKKADAIVSRLAELLGDAKGGGLLLRQQQTQLSPATAMAAWLADKQAPHGFSIDRECELKQPDSEKSAVRYARHTLDIDEVGEHIKSGKLPTQLALTWAGRVSFVLTDTLALKKIKLLDVVLEAAEKAAGAGGQAENNFDADVALATGELRLLIPDLLAALGGELSRDAAPPAVVPTAPGTSTAPWEEAVPA